MQLKKHLTVARNVVTVSAVAAMLAVSMPAFASNGLNLGGTFRAGLELNIKGSRKGTEDGDKGERADRTGSASATASVICRTAAGHAHSDAIKAAQTERDTELKAAHDVLEAAIKAARDQYRLSLSASSSLIVSATGTSDRDGDWKEHHMVNIQARKAYAAAVKTARQAYIDAKHKIMAAFRDATRPADDAYRAARLACRTNATVSASGTAQ